MKLELELTELLAVETLLVLEIEKIEKKSEKDEYDNDNLRKYKNILNKIKRKVYGRK